LLSRTRRRKTYILEGKVKVKGGDRRKNYSIASRKKNRTKRRKGYFGNFTGAKGRVFDFLRKRDHERRRLGKLEKKNQEYRHAEGGKRGRSGKLE